MCKNNNPMNRRRTKPLPIRNKLREIDLRENGHRNRNGYEEVQKLSLEVEQRQKVLLTDCKSCGGNNVINC